MTGDDRDVESVRLHDHQGVPAGAHQHADVVRVLHALADPTRLSLVHLLADGARRVVDLTEDLGLAQSTVSAHLATLRAAGLVTATPEGRATRYSLADPELDELLGAAERVVARTGEHRWATSTAGTGTAGTATTTA
ncbi:hypothetical protein AGMMS50218_09390 [Actinomycetota bacterium]|nr:hypothetical protein AGMMS50218_09390 [Actinomycetota bacterium]